MLRRAWDRRELADDDRLSATIAQRSAFLATSRLRGREAIEWAERADGARARGPRQRPARRSVAGARDRASPARDTRPTPRSTAGSTIPRRHRTGRASSCSRSRGSCCWPRATCAARARRSRRRRAESLERGLLVVAALSLSGLTRVECLAGEWDNAVVSGERAIALAVESEDHWVIGQAHWSASYVPAAVGDWAVADAHVRAIHAQSPTFERHVAAESIAAAGLAAAQDRPGDVLRALEPLEQMQAGDGVDDPAFLPWHHLKAHALVDVGELEAAERFIASAAALARAAREPAAGHEARPRPRQARVRPSRSPSGRGRCSRRRGRWSSRSACPTSRG